MSLLRLQSVAKSYRRGSHESQVLRDVSLDVDAGSLVSIYGQRNAGKTSLLKIAAGFAPPDRGQVLFDGIDLAAVSDRKLARIHRGGIVWVERNGPHTPELTIGDYLALPLYSQFGSRAARRLALGALARYGVEEHADERWADLSDCARILCAIAHAMVRRPRLLIADDPTGGLGILDRERVCSVLRAAAEHDGIAVLMAVPDMPAMLHAHHVRLLSGGRLIAPATPATGDDGGDGGGGDNVVDLPRRGARRSA